VTARNNADSSRPVFEISWPARWAVAPGLHLERGRALTSNVGGGEAWNWTVYGIAVTNHPPAGQAPTREAAQAAFKAAWATCQPRKRDA
jgi:hypothetical protein